LEKLLADFAKQPLLLPCFKENFASLMVAVEYML
jgi:hypothetical protein